MGDLTGETGWERACSGEDDNMEDLCGGRQ